MYKGKIELQEQERLLGFEMLVVMGVQGNVHTERWGGELGALLPDTNTEGNKIETSSSRTL
jgi:hypothetical protein